MNLYTELIQTLGIAPYIELGWHGNDPHSSGTDYRWNISKQQLEFRLQNTWVSSKWHSKVVAVVAEQDTYDLSYWTAEDGSYQMWSVACAARDAKISVVHSTPSSFLYL